MFSQLEFISRSLLGGSLCWSLNLSRKCDVYHFCYIHNRETYYSIAISEQMGRYIWRYAPSYLFCLDELLELQEIWSSQTGDLEAVSVNIHKREWGR